MWLFVFFILIPVIEIALFIQVGGLIGLWPTIALVLLSAVVGTMLIRRQGARAMMELQTSFRELRDPTRPIAHGAMILFAGALLLTPGFFTDTIGLLLLIPAVRDWAMKQFSSRVKVTRSGFGFDGRPRGQTGFPPRDGVIDGDYTVETDYDAYNPTPPDFRPRNPKSPPSGWTRHSD